MRDVVRVPRLLLPAAGVDLTRWAVVACDQYTAQPEYWDEVESFVGNAPSTLRMVLPEVHLGAPDVAARVAACHRAMRVYRSAGLLVEHEALVLVERTTSAGLRRGLLVELDLDAYDYAPDSRTPVRATEGTVLDRLPPRMAVRRDAALELPHVLVLYDDPHDTVLGPLLAAPGALAPAYDVDLMGGAGHVAGHVVEPEHAGGVLDALAALAGPGTDPLLYAVGDGNHSLAAARAVWQERRAAGAPPDDPARHALVELVNLHDASMVFEPIHRVVFGAAGLADDLAAALGATRTPAASPDAVRTALSTPGLQRFALVTPDGLEVFEVPRPAHRLTVGTVQGALDAWLDGHPAADVDYVHGDDVVLDLGRRVDAAGLLLPGVSKDAFFTSIAADGPLPRKTFSLGHASDKRFYLECRAIR